MGGGARGPYLARGLLQPADSVRNLGVWFDSDFSQSKPDSCRSNMITETKGDTRRLLQETDLQLGDVRKLTLLECDKDKFLGDNHFRPRAR